MVFNALSVEDKEKIQAYIDRWVGETAHGLPADLKEVLDNWNYAKRDLFNMLGNQLIIKKYVNIQLSEEEQTGRMTTAAYKTEFTNFTYEFRKQIRNLQVDSGMEDNLYHLVDSKTFVKNVWDRENCIFIDPKSNKKIQFNTGASIMKILAKFAKLWDLEQEFETLRCAHSQIIGTGSFKGNLCLSIHPLDFMTMSDNACNWTSCMSWTSNRGSFRQGSVEMMNSPIALMCYLEASTPYDLGLGIKNYQWNNKQWRELIFVDGDDIITEVKAYPFECRQLSEMAVEWVRELRPNADYYPRMDWVYFEDNLIDNKQVYIEFNFNHMYNDFDTNKPTHMTYIGKYFVECMGPRRRYGKIVEGIRDVSRKLNFIPDPIQELERVYIEASGYSQCMWCGQNFTDANVDYDCDWEVYNGRLTCDDCNASKCCHYCGCDVAEDEVNEFDGHYWCPECFSEHVGYDVLTDSFEYYNSMANIYLVRDDFDEECDRWWNANVIHTYDAKELNHYLNEDCEVHKLDGEYSAWYVRASDCPLDTLIMFDIYGEENLAKYLERIKDF